MPHVSGPCFAISGSEMAAGAAIWRIISVIKKPQIAEFVTTACGATPEHEPAHRLLVQAARAVKTYTFSASSCLTSSSSSLIRFSRSGRRRMTA